MVSIEYLVNYGYGPLVLNEYIELNIQDFVALAPPTKSNHNQIAGYFTSVSTSPCSGRYRTPMAPMLP